MKKGKTLKTYATISHRTHTATPPKREVNVNPVYLCTHTKRKVVVQQCKVVSAAVIFGTTRRQRGSEDREYVLSSPFSCYHCTFGNRIPSDKI